jgi:hypothetical protein
LKNVYLLVWGNVEVVVVVVCEFESQEVE